MPLRVYGINEKLEMLCSVHMCVGVCVYLYVYGAPIGRCPIPFIWKYACTCRKGCPHSARYC